MPRIFSFLFFALLLFFISIGGAITWGYISDTLPEQNDPLAFSFTPFPESQKRELYSSPRPATSTESVFTDAATGQTIEHYFFPRPMNIQELAKELETDETTLQDLEKSIQGAWQAYKQNPNPQLEEMKQRFAERFRNLVQKVVDVVSGTPLSSEQIATIREAVLQDSLTPEFKAEEEKLLGFGSIDDTKPLPPGASLHRAGAIACVSPNTCYRQGTGREPVVEGVNIWMPCCGNGDCNYEIEIGCLDICAGAAIYDYCTGLCGCE